MSTRKRIAITTTAAWLTLLAPGTAQAKPRPDLVVRSVTASVSGSSVAVEAVVRNDGGRRARASRVEFRLNTAAPGGLTDLLLGTLRASALKPGRKTTVSGSLPVPLDARGVFLVEACADVTDRVRERREGNNCRTTQHMVSIIGPPLPPLGGGGRPTDQRIPSTEPCRPLWPVGGSARGTGRGAESRSRV